MIRIGSNIESLGVQRHLAAGTAALSRSLERLSSGSRINRASDDAAGLAIASNLTAQSRVYTQALRNGNDAISALSIQDSALSQLSEVTARLRELATQASSGSFSRVQRLSLDKEGDQLVKEFNRIVSSVSFNGIRELSGDTTSLLVQLGFGTSGSIGISLNSNLRRSIGEGLRNLQNDNFYHNSSVETSVAGDINGDGKADIIRTGSGSDIDIFYGSSNGISTNPDANISLSFIGSASDVNVADFNGDGRLDIFASDGSTTEILLQQSDGSFQTAPDSVSIGSPIATADPNGSGQRAADINGDGKLDLIGTDGSLSVLVAFGDGHGGFSSPITALTKSQEIFQLEVIDFNGDGRLDILAHDGDLSLYTGQGNGQFSSGTTLITGLATVAGFSVADTNYDGLQDIVVNGSTVRLYRGTSSGGVSSAISLGTGMSSGSMGKIEIRDVDGDGIVDITSASQSGSLQIRYGLGDGSFQSAASVSALGRNFNIADFNGDGVLDLLTTQDGNSPVHSNPTDSAFSLVLGVAQNTTTIQRINLTTQDTARAALSSLAQLAEKISQDRGLLGAYQSRINVALGVLGSQRDTGLEASARISQVDVAEESSEVARRQILQTSAAALLAQANQAPRLALQLLSGF